MEEMNYIIVQKINKKYDIDEFMEYIGAIIGDKKKRRYKEVIRPMLSEDKQKSVVIILLSLLSDPSNSIGNKIIKNIIETRLERGETTLRFPNNKEKRMYQLDNFEFAVLYLLDCGLHVHDISRVFCISESTIKLIKKNIPISHIDIADNSAYDYNFENFIINNIRELENKDVLSEINKQYNVLSDELMLYFQQNVRINEINLEILRIINYAIEKVKKAIKNVDIEDTEQ